MLQLKHPGIYTQLVPSGVRSISGAATSVALFVGPTASGIDGRLTRVQSFGEFERLFGGLSQTSNLSYGVLHFFANGGGEAIIKRVKPSGALPAKTALQRDGSANTSISIEALSSGDASNDIYVEIDSFDIGAFPFSTTSAQQKLFNLSVIDARSGTVERFSGLSVASNSARFALDVVNDEATGSRLVKLDMPPTAINAERPVTTGTVYELVGMPMAGNFAGSVKVTVNIAVRDAAGTVQAGLAVSIPDVEIFAANTPKPTNPRAIAFALQSAVNLAIRSNAALAARMKGVELTTAICEGGKYLWLRTSQPGSPARDNRLLDAVVTLAAPGGGTSFLAECINGAAKVTNPSRYRLGGAYLPAAGSQVVAASVVTGLDGDPSGQPSDTDFKNAVLALETPDPFFNLLCLPDLVRASPTNPKMLHHSNALSVYSEAARICALKFAFLLLDPPPDVIDVGSAEAFKVSRLSLEPASARSTGFYFPNIRVDDPLTPGTIAERPPSGAMAGIFARTDAQYGVWQAPAGTEAVVSGAYGPAVELSDSEHGTLNVVGVNVIRKFPLYGVVSYGSRTYDGANAVGSEWKYVPVIRTANYILRSLSEGLRWAVHKPNGEVLWSQLRLNTTTFMHGLFRLGAFKGVSAREAYFVQCDASTTSPDDINQGIVNIVVGFAPLKPAEFVVISLRQIVQPAA